MDMTARRRNGKGIGNRTEAGPLEIADGTVSNADVMRGEVQESAADAAGSEQPLALALNEGAGVGGSFGTESVMVANPFWSERAQDEARLAAARPDFLGSAESNQVSASSGSTELRADDTVRGGLSSHENLGRPVSYGPNVAVRTTVEQGVRHSEEARTATLREQPGLSSREREILTAMKEAMQRLAGQNEGLLEQNSALMERVRKLEEERSTEQTAGWHSTEEHPELVEHNGLTSLGREDVGVGHTDQGDNQGVDLEVLGSLKYEQGYQQGYLAAKQTLRDLSASVEGGAGAGTVGDSTAGLFQGSSAPMFGAETPPPNPYRHWNLGCNTTPHGTPIPRGPPPEDSKCTVAVKHDGVGNHVGSYNSPTMLRGGDSCETSGMAPRMTSFHGGETVPAWPSRTRPSLEGLGMSSGVTSHELPNLPEASESSRDPYAPGDKVYWSLPTLADTFEEPDPATRASDWLEMVEPIMADITPMSGVWWSRVIAEARRWYQVWIQSSAIERGLVRPVPTSELQGLRFRRLESRAYAMLLAATPTSIRDELVANRETNCVALIFHVLRTYQPGGLQERTTLLEMLSNPGTTTSPAEAVQKLRSWGRALGRAMAMQISIPDSSLMLRGLDLLADPILKKHPHVSFRCSQARNALQLDHTPTLHGVKEFGKSFNLSLTCSPCR